MKRGIIVTVLVSLFTTASILAQPITTEKRKTESFVDLGVGFAASENILTAGYYKSWNLSKEKRILKNMYIGTGARFTGFTGKDIYFTSAPADLYGNAEKEDSLFGPTPYIYAVNGFVNFGYQFSDRLQVGFDLDAIGFSFGPTGTPSFIAEGVEQTSEAKPTTFNALLGGANDLGTLNGGLYVRYKVTDKVGVRLTYHTLFTELTTTTIEQTVPVTNDRFRHGANLIGLGASYYF